MLFLSCHFYSQGTIKIIKISKNDSISLTKDSRKNYFLKIYYKRNIDFNKKNKLKPIVYAGGYSFCKKCKKEFDIYIIEEFTRIPSKNKEYTLENFIYINSNKTEYFDFEKFWNNYFKIDNKYYKLTNRGPIE